MRELRLIHKLSLPDAGRLIGISHIALGSYERGSRNPPLWRAEKILNAYGHTLRAIPLNDNVLRRQGDMAAELRAIAEQLDGLEGVNQIVAYDRHTALGEATLRITNE